MAMEMARNDSTISALLLIHGAWTSSLTVATSLTLRTGWSPAISTQIASVDPPAPTAGS
jgi:hypothetical protein